MLETLGLVLVAVGALGSAATAWWLLRGFDPTNPRYVDDGVQYPGRRSSTVVPNLLEDQRKVAALLAGSTTLQFIGAALVLISS